MNKFDQLRAANIRRQAEWPGGENITAAFRGLELAGEVGELANPLKKLVRIELGIKGTTEDKRQLTAQIEEEIGDVAICIDLIGMQYAEALKSAGLSRIDKPLDPSTYHDTLCLAGTLLDRATGDLADMAAVGVSGEIKRLMAEAWAALEDVAYCVRKDIWECVQIKFNMTSRKHGFKTMLVVGEA